MTSDHITTLRAMMRESNEIAVALECVLNERQRLIDERDSARTNLAAADQALAAMQLDRDNAFVLLKRTLGERDAHKAAFEREIDGNIALRIQHKAGGDETMARFVSRICAERDAAQSRVQELEAQQSSLAEYDAARDRIAELEERLDQATHPPIRTRCKDDYLAFDRDPLSVIHTDGKEQPR